MTPTLVLALAVAEVVGEVAEEAVAGVEEEVDEVLANQHILRLLPLLLLKGLNFWWRSSQTVIVG